MDKRISVNEVKAMLHSEGILKYARLMLRVLEDKSLSEEQWLWLSEWNRVFFTIPLGSLIANTIVVDDEREATEVLDGEMAALRNAVLQHAKEIAKHLLKGKRSDA
jgi:hypothetical protein